MAEGVNLTSKKWRDIVFEGKNKDFGAYQLRQKSFKFHLWAILGILALMAVVGLSVWGYISYQRAKAEAEEAAKGADMTAAQIDAQVEEVEEEDEDIEVEYEEPEIEEEPLVEEVATQAIVDIAFVEEPDPEKQVKTVDDIMANEATISTKNQEGTVDPSAILNKTETFTPPPAPEPKVEPVPEVKKPEPEKIFTAVEQSASFPGGQGALSSWLGKNLRYPELAAQNNIEGRVIVQFVVEKDGSITDIKVARGVDKDLDKEAVRVVRKMPKWQPGKNNGIAVRSQFTLPVNFKLEQR
ncbi:MAG: energy transducer TonB [Prevotella sp.]|nr:energy transducer TonB [Prevotella sp.]MCM1075253.1 energy transducer TonB [Ruminococcus sp.]